jgi:hypothetical protein
VTVGGNGDPSGEFQGADFFERTLLSIRIGAEPPIIEIRLLYGSDDIFKRGIGG